jgi:hypothetical protein
MRSGSILKLLIVGLVPLLAAASGHDSTMRREAHKSLSVGDQGQLHAAVSELKERVRNAQVQDEDFDIKEDDLLEDADDEEMDERALLQGRQTTTGCQNAANSKTSCNGLSTPQCGWAATIPAGACGVDSNKNNRTSCCRDCKALHSNDCKTANSEGAKCVWEQSSCKYVSTSSSSLSETFNGATKTHKDETNTSLDSATSITSSSTDAQGKSDVEAEKGESFLEDEDDDDFDEEDSDVRELDSRNLLVGRTISSTLDCKKQVTQPLDKTSSSTCNKATADQCGWNSSSKQCRDCGNLTKSDCETANSGGSKCTWFDAKTKCEAQ